jgi:hypothetical protein
MYRVVRIAALVWCRAVKERKPLSQTCSEAEFLQIWMSTWRVPLTTWRAALGVFNWVMMSIVPSCHKTPHERFVRTMFMISMVSRAVDNWHVCLESAEAAVKLQRWLREEEGGGGGVVAGGDMIAKHGYVGPGWK